MRVLFMSGYSDDTVVEGTAAGDASLFLAKPFAPAALAIRIREALDLPPPKML